MPRDGSGVYTLPPGTTAVTDTTIESTKYNGFTGDVATDLNAPRPVIAGGTGASTASQARVNLQAERAMQIVTNFDSQVWESGSFYAAAGATSAPNASAPFIGTAQVQDSSNIIVNATDFNTGYSYFRRKAAGAWGAWLSDPANKVDKAGDTMTGNLQITKTTPVFTLDSTDPAQQALLQYTRSGVGRWQIIMQSGPDTGGTTGSTASDLLFLRLRNDGTFLDTPFSIARADGAVFFTHDINLQPATGHARLTLNNPNGNVSVFQSMNAGLLRWVQYLTSDFQLQRYNDAGAGIDFPLTISRANGGVTFGAAGNFTIGKDNPAVPGGGILADGTTIALRGFGNNPIYIQNSNPTTISYGQFNSSGLQVTGSVVATSNIQTTTGAIYGQYYYVRSDSNPSINFQNAAGSATIGAVYASGGDIHLYNQSGGRTVTLDAGGKVLLARGFNSKAGADGASIGNIHNFAWVSPNVQVWVDNSNIGNISVTSDYRIKKDVADLPSMWDRVKTLRPIKYTQDQYTPAIEIKNRIEQALELRERDLEKDAKEIEALGPMFRADDVERWGFIAHEVQDVLVPSAAEGVKDAPDVIQSLNLAPIVATLTKALQEAMARIEALEARA